MQYTKKATYFTQKMHSFKEAAVEHLKKAVDYAFAVHRKAQLLAVIFDGKDLPDFELEVFDPKLETIGFYAWDSVFKEDVINWASFYRNQKNRVNLEESAIYPECGYYDNEKEIVYLTKNHSVLTTINGWNDIEPFQELTTYQVVMLIGSLESGDYEMK